LLVRQLEEPIMPIAVYDVPAWTDQGLNGGHPTDPETVRLRTVLSDATKAAEVLDRHSYDYISSQRQPWDY
jgi:hypothetical protein